ncbi:MAG: F0F1 ATP synthase subunit epsilon [Verrucomicrobiae bacterium]|nr:F0F1 ATP synthase subunit epsilon [Verrucomicrobiae bacterium]
MTEKKEGTQAEMKVFRLEIITPEGCLPEQQVGFLDVPAAHGRLTVLAHHEPFVALLKPGLVRIRPALNSGGTPVEEKWRVAQGVLTVEPERVTLVVRAAERLK